MVARVVSTMQDHVAEAAAALKKVANDNLSPDSTPATVDLNMALLQVETIAADLEQLVFQVEDALSGGVVHNPVASDANYNVAVQEEPSASMDSDDDVILPTDTSSEELLVESSDDGMTIESDRSWRL